MQNNLIIKIKIKEIYENCIIKKKGNTKDYYKSLNQRKLEYRKMD